MRSLVVLALLLSPLVPAYAQQSEWTSFHGDLASTKFSNVTTLTPETVGDLERAWEYRTGDVSDGSGDLAELVCWAMLWFRLQGCPLGLWLNECCFASWLHYRSW